MKTIELIQNRAVDAEQITQQGVVFMVGNKPVAALLPIADRVAHLAKFKEIMESEESVTLMIGGRQVAIIQPLVPFVLIEDEETDLEAVTLSTHPQFLELIEQSRRRHKAEGGISSDEMRRRLGL